MSFTYLIHFAVRSVSPGVICFKCRSVFGLVLYLPWDPWLKTVFIPCDRLAGYAIRWGFIDLLFAFSYAKNGERMMETSVSSLLKITVFRSGGGFSFLSVSFISFNNGKPFILSRLKYFFRQLKLFQLIFQLETGQYYIYFHAVDCFDLG